MARAGSGEPVPSCRQPRCQPLCGWHLNHPFQPMPRVFLVPVLFSRKTLQEVRVGTAAPLTPGDVPSPLPPTAGFLSDSFPGPWLLPLSESKVGGKMEGWEQGPAQSPASPLHTLPCSPLRWWGRFPGTRRGTSFPLDSMESQEESFLSPLAKIKCRKPGRGGRACPPRASSGASSAVLDEDWLPHPPGPALTRCPDLPAEGSGQRGSGQSVGGGPSSEAGGRSCPWAPPEQGSRVKIVAAGILGENPPGPAGGQSTSILRSLLH